MSEEGATLPIDKVISGMNIPHIIENIFFQLDYKSFKTCWKVNKKWKELLTSEPFKKKAKHHFKKEIDKEIWSAVWNNDIEKVGNLLSEDMVNVNGRGICESTLLCSACVGLCGPDQKVVVQLLLENGADVNMLDCWKTPLSYAVTEGNENLVNLLLSAGAEIDKRNYEGATPLAYAALHGKRKIVHILLHNGADPNAQDSEGKTPLHHASIMDRTDVVFQLLEAGAKPDIVDKKGNLWMDYAFDGAIEEINKRKLQLNNILLDRFRRCRQVARLDNPHYW